MDSHHSSTHTSSLPLLTRTTRALHQAATRLAAGMDAASLSTDPSEIDEYRAGVRNQNPRTWPIAGPPNRVARTLLGIMPDGPGPLIDYPDGYFRPVPDDFHDELERSDIPFTRRVYNRSGSIMGEVERLREDGVLVIRPVHGVSKVSHLYALFTRRRYVPMADA